MVVAIFAAVKIVVNVLLLAWLVLLSVLWMMTPGSNNLIQQCSNAAQIAALAIIGYAAARGLTMVVTSVETLIKVATDKVGGDGGGSIVE